MKRSFLVYFVGTTLCAFLAWVGTHCASAQDSTASGLNETDGQIVIGNTQALIRSVLSLAARGDDEQLAATTRRPRGSTSEIYSQVAPAVVLVTTPTGHGTGFFISEDGWILTNAHVVDGATSSRGKRKSVVSVLMGRVGADGWMEPVDSPPVNATIYRVSQRQDLALLKLDQLPSGDRKSTRLNSSH